MIRAATLALLLLLAAPVRGASVGVDLQAYPAGLIGTACAGISDGASEISVHAGYDATDRRDWGEHDDESGGGPGFGLAWRRPWGDSARWVWGARADVWFLDIDWEQDGHRGKTHVTVLQPTVHAGRRWPVGETISLVAHAALGVEINVHTQGEDVGQGPILLLGLTASFSR